MRDRIEVCRIHTLRTPAEVIKLDALWRLVTAYQFPRNLVSLAHPTLELIVPIPFAVSGSYP